MSAIYLFVRLLSISKPDQSRGKYFLQYAHHINTFPKHVLCPWNGSITVFLWGSHFIDAAFVEKAHHPGNSSSKWQNCIFTLYDRSSVHYHCQFSQAFMSVGGDRCLEVLGVKLVCNQSVQFDVSFESWLERQKNEVKHRKQY